DVDVVYLGVHVGPEFGVGEHGPEVEQVGAPWGREEGKPEGAEGVGQLGWRIGSGEEGGDDAGVVVEDDAGVLVVPELAGHVAEEVADPFAAVAWVGDGEGE